jgi:hypothetical protein
MRRQFFGFEEQGLPDPGEQRAGDADECSHRKPPPDAKYG